MIFDVILQRSAGDVPMVTVLHHALPAFKFRILSLLNVSGEKGYELDTCPDAGGAAGHSPYHFPCVAEK